MSLTIRLYYRKLEEKCRYSNIYIKIELMKKKKLTEEHKKNISKSMLGAKNPAYGKPLSSEHKNKIRVFMLHFWNIKKTKTNII